ncbi:MAG: DUF3793 family protein [Clostridiales bacterium]|nr:DUF3793 family protein [Clostridiales bacterium]
MIERYLIENCSPTLASIKTANAFSCRFEKLETLENSISLWNEIFKPKGLKLFLLRAERHGVALVYVCRPDSLAKDLQKPGVSEFLRTFGYESAEVQYALKKLKARLGGYDVFPHEIGIFLGYPLADVRGFIEMGGAGCKCTGCWKVYCNECEAVKTFEKFKKCRAVYMKLWQSGERSVYELTVSA